MNRLHDCVININILTRGRVRNKKDSREIWLVGIDEMENSVKRFGDLGGGWRNGYHGDLHCEKVADLGGGWRKVAVKWFGSGGRRGSLLFRRSR